MASTSRLPIGATTGAQLHSLLAAQHHWRDAHQWPSGQWRRWADGATLALRARPYASEAALRCVADGVCALAEMHFVAIGSRNRHELSCASAAGEQLEPLFDLLDGRLQTADACAERWREESAEGRLTTEECDEAHRWPRRLLRWSLDTLHQVSERVGRHNYLSACGSSDSLSSAYADCAPVNSVAQIMVFALKMRLSPALNECITLLLDAIAGGPAFEWIVAYLARQNALAEVDLRAVLQHLCTDDDDALGNDDVGIRLRAAGTLLAALVRDRPAAAQEDVAEFALEAVRLRDGGRLALLAKMVQCCDELRAVVCNASRLLACLTPSTLYTLRTILPPAPTVLAPGATYSHLAQNCLALMDAGAKVDLFTRLLDEWILDRKKEPLDGDVPTAASIEVAVAVYRCLVTLVDEGSFAAGLRPFDPTSGYHKPATTGAGAFNLGARMAHAASRPTRLSRLVDVYLNGGVHRRTLAQNVLWQCALACHTPAATGARIVTELLTRAMDENSVIAVATFWSCLSLCLPNVQPDRIAVDVLNALKDRLDQLEAVEKDEWRPVQNLMKILDMEKSQYVSVKYVGLRSALCTRAACPFIRSHLLALDRCLRTVDELGSSTSSMHADGPLVDFLRCHVRLADALKVHLDEGKAVVNESPLGAVVFARALADCQATLVRVADGAAADRKDLVAARHLCRTLALRLSDLLRLGEHAPVASAAYVKRLLEHFIQFGDDADDGGKPLINDGDDDCVLLVEQNLKDAKLAERDAAGLVHTGRLKPRTRPGLGPAVGAGVDCLLDVIERYLFENSARSKAAQSWQAARPARSSLLPDPTGSQPATLSEHPSTPQPDPLAGRLLAETTVERLCAGKAVDHAYYAWRTWNVEYTELGRFAATAARLNSAPCGWPLLRLIAQLSSSHSHSRAGAGGFPYVWFCAPALKAALMTAMARCHGAPGKVVDRMDAQTKAMVDELAAVLLEGGIIPKRMAYAIDLCSKVSMHKAHLILNDLWNFVKDSLPAHGELRRAHRDATSNPEKPSSAHTANWPKPDADQYLRTCRAVLQEEASNLALCQYYAAAFGAANGSGTTGGGKAEFVVKVQR